MNPVFGLAIYFICWWITLFAILPLGVRTQKEAGIIEPGTPESAPDQPQIVKKFLLTTVVSAVVFAFIYAIIVHKIIALDDIPFLPRFEN